MVLTREQLCWLLSVSIPISICVTDPSISPPCSFILHSLFLLLHTPAAPVLAGCLNSPFKTCPCLLCSYHVWLTRSGIYVPCHSMVCFLSLWILLVWTLKAVVFVLEKPVFSLVQLQSERCSRVLITVSFKNRRYAMPKPMCQRVSSSCGACFPPAESFIIFVQSTAFLVHFICLGALCQQGRL